LILYLLDDGIAAVGRLMLVFMSNVNI